MPERDKKRRGEEPQGERESGKMIERGKKRWLINTEEIRDRMTNGKLRDR